MDYLFIVRHGLETGSNQELSLDGKKSLDIMVNQIELISNLAAYGSHMVLSSKFPRSLNSAKVFVDWFGVPMMSYDALSIALNDVPSKELDSIDSIIDVVSNKYEVITAITQGEVAQAFGSYFVKKHFGVAVNNHWSKNGEGYYIDCKTGKLEKIPFS